MLRYLGPLLFGFGGTAILISLCVWQLQRLDWKETLIAEIDARIAEPAVELPDDPDPQAQAFLPVEEAGTMGVREIHVLTSRRGDGPGFRVIAPFLTDFGRTIMVDRGFVAEAEKTSDRATGPMAVTGNLHWPRESDWFTPEPDRDRNIWFARDVAAMATELEAEPILLVARIPTGTPSPRPIPVTVDLPNNHLQYAITWGLLAVLWLAMTLYLLLRIRRNTV